MRPTLLLLLVLLVACGGPQRDQTPPPPPPDAAPELAMDEETARATAEGMLEVLTTMAAIVEQRAGDCATMAVELGALFDQAAPLVEIIETAKKDAEAARLLGAAMQELELKVTPVAERISPALATCNHDPAVAEAMQKMPVF